MFEDERECASLHCRGAIARGVAKRGLVAFLAFAMAFGTTPAQLWAEGAEGIAEAVAQAATPGEGTGAADGAAEQSGAEVSIPGARLRLVPPQQRQQLATKARRRGEPCHERAVFDGAHWPSRICRRGCRPDREPDRNRRCRQEAS